jgi:hypothetical protein
MPLLHRQMIEVLGIKNAAKLVPIEDDMVPVDPITENQNLLTNKPVKAFIEQNHQAHIQVHMAAVQNPKIQQIIQGNPMAQQIYAATMAHINEHVAMEYRRQIEEAMGMVLPGEENNKDVPPEMADQIAIKAAQASQQLLQRDQAEAQQAAAQQQMQDPIVQMQMQELQLKMKDLELKAQKQATDAAAKADQLEIEMARIEAQKEIAAMQVAASAASQRDKINKSMEMEGAKLGVQIAKDRAQQNRPQRQPERSKT